MAVSIAPTTSFSLSNRVRRSTALNGAVQLFRDRLYPAITHKDKRAIAIIERSRPKALRTYDQIPMRSGDLLRQVKLVAPYLAGKRVAFMGDYDSTSLLIGLLAKQKSILSPAYMLLLDFDDRLLTVARNLAKQYSFEDLLDVRLYNAFDPISSDLIGKFDSFYTNPPYGCHNLGESARLFITRGCELVGQNDASGCIILPDDENRPWTRLAMYSTQRFLCGLGWTIDEKINKLHQYHLDDDLELASSMILVKRDGYLHNESSPMPYAGRRVDFDEIPHFYGRSVLLPYPQYILQEDNYE
jgi:predicted methyltransferase